MKNNPYYLDFDDQKGMSPERVRKIKENNYEMVVALNHLAKAIKQGPDAIRRFRKELGNHDIVKHPDSETGMNTYDFTNKLRFLASQLEKDMFIRKVTRTSATNIADGMSIKQQIKLLKHLEATTLLASRFIFNKKKMLCQ